MQTRLMTKLSRPKREAFAEFSKRTCARLFSPGKQSTTHTLAAAAFALGLGAVLSHAAAPTSPQGVITAKGYLNISGTAVANLTGNAKFPDKPDVVYYHPYFEWNPTGDITTQPNNAYGENYGAQMLGYFYPPASGDYVFWVCADDQAVLYLATDDNPANKKLIATEQGWSNPRQWDTANGGALEAKNSQTYTGTQWATKDTTYGGAKITLQANKAYYIEAIFKEGGGGDNLAVAVAAPNSSIDQSMPIPGKYLSTIDKNSGPVKIVTQPLSQTVNEGEAVTFSVTADGTPPYTYQWKRNGTDIAGVATSASSYTISRASAADNNAKISVAITGAQGSVTSADAVLTVKSDTTPPAIASVSGSVTFNSVTVTFSEPLAQAAAETAANYKLTGGVTVSAAKLAGAPGSAGDNKVILTTSKQAEGTTLTLTVSNVKDATGNTIAVNTTKDFKTHAFASGFVLQKFWENNSGNNIAALTGDARFPDSPTFVTIEPRWEYGPNGSNESGSNYGNQLVGWFTPAKSGDYIFFTNSDDPSNLYLSTDDNPANKKLIAQESGWSGARQWVGVGGGSTLEDKRSDSFASTEWPSGNTITLQAGKRYYMESLHTEGGGGDSVGATFIMAGEANPANGDAPKLTGALIGTYLDPNGASVNVVQQPADATAQAGRTATFSASASGVSAYGKSVSYQWQKANPGSSTFADVTGATKSTYTTPILALTDTGAKFRVIATVPTLSVNSSAATVTVVPDTFAPVVTKVGSVLKGSNIEIGVGFDEALDDPSAGTAANYALSKGAVSKVRVEKYDTPRDPTAVVTTAGAVVLETTGLAKGDTVTVTVKNVKDSLGNGIAAAGVSKSLTVTSKMSWVAVGGNDYQQGATPTGWDQTGANYYDDVVALSNDKDFDLISGGSANWNNYDEATFVFEQVTGDFDRVARVEYQDPSSQWARAGLMIRKTLDADVARAQVDGGYAMSQNMIVRVNPTVQWNGTGGNNSYEWIWRDTDGGNYANSGGGGIPAYPNAWLRIQRTGQTFTGYSSSDGVTWANIGTHNFPSDAELPSTVYVGPYFAPELTNNDSWKIGHSVVAKFRDYGPFTVAQPAPTLSIVRTATGITFTFEGTLQAADSVVGPWADVTGGSPQTVTTSGAMKFYRAKR